MLEDPLKRFEPLRQMESFSEDMFNRIISFQEKEHAAWNESLPFTERIKGLPLHYLIFSTPDRDPAVYGPTVAHYYPLHEEIQKIAYYTRQVAKQPVLCDLHSRNGFVGSLIAREGIKVMGLRDPNEKPNQIMNFFDAERYELRSGTVTDIDLEFDIAFSSWMPAEQNLTPQIVAHHPKLIIYIYTDHIDESTGQRQTGTVQAFTGLPAQYKLIDQWTVTRQKDLLHEIWPDLSRNIAETRICRIYADLPYHTIPPYTTHTSPTPYDWEQDLQMASLAMEAKQQLQRQGFQV